MDNAMQPVQSSLQNCIAFFGSVPVDLSIRWRPAGVNKLLDESPIALVTLEVIILEDPCNVPVPLVQQIPGQQLGTADVIVLYTGAVYRDDVRRMEPYKGNAKLVNPREQIQVRTGKSGFGTFNQNTGGRIGQNSGQSLPFFSIRLSVK